MGLITVSVMEPVVVVVCR